MSFKVAIIGTAGVGKTHFLNKIGNESRKNRIYVASCGNEIRRIRYRDKNIDFIDSAGQEIYCSSTINNDHYIDLDLLILMVDGNPRSYKVGRKIASEILSKYFPSRVMLVQNKIDIIENDRLLSRAHKISVKNNDGIEDLMNEIVGNL